MFWKGILALLCAYSTAEIDDIDGGANFGRTLLYEALR